MIQEYCLAQSISDALRALQDSQGQARILAGGTDLVLDIHDGKHPLRKLVDITRIPELTEIKLEPDCVKIGAGVTHSQVAQSPLIKQYLPALAEGSSRVGSLQIRNIATLAGNVINAQPAADAAVPLTALGAVLEVIDADGYQSIAMEKAYLDVGKSAVDSSRQLVTAIKVPLPGKNESSSFIRLDQRKALALPMLNVAVAVELDPALHKFIWARIVMAPVGPGPVRAYEAEALLQDTPIDPDLILKAARTAAAHANPRSSLIRGSREYRLQVMPVLVKRALTAAVHRVRQQSNLHKGGTNHA